MAVTGIGGVFFKAKDPDALRAWYKQHLGIDVQDWGGAVFETVVTDKDATSQAAAWRIVSQDDESFAPTTSPFMVNYLVSNLPEMLKTLRQAGIEIIGEFDEAEQGKFGWLLDPEGNKIELWEPQD